MDKKYFFSFIDDAIWIFRDLTRQRPASLFDHPFFAILKNAHDRWGLKTQISSTAPITTTAWMNSTSPR